MDVRKVLQRFGVCPPVDGNATAEKVVVKRGASVGKTDLTSIAGFGGGGGAGNRVNPGYPYGSRGSGEVLITDNAARIYPDSYQGFMAALVERAEAADGFNRSLCEWSIDDWFMAYIGEVGELANVLKKQLRGDAGLDPFAVGDEAADAFTYLYLLCLRAGRDLSKEFGFQVTWRDDYPVRRLPCESEGVRHLIVQSAMLGNALHVRDNETITETVFEIIRTLQALSDCKTPVEFRYRVVNKFNQVSGRIGCATFIEPGPRDEPGGD
jgi:NTP pyrophosphatase (non-canonical NTP hydrolase)